MVTSRTRTQVIIGAAACPPALLVPATLHISRKDTGIQHKKPFAKKITGERRGCRKTPCPSERSKESFSGGNYSVLALFNGENSRSVSLRTSDRRHDKQGSRHGQALNVARKSRVRMFLARRVGVAIRISLSLFCCFACTKERRIPTPVLRHWLGMTGVD